MWFFLFLFVWLIKKIFGGLVLLLAISMAILWNRGFFEASHKEMTHSEAAETWLKVKPKDLVVHSGDLVFRMGRGFISHSMQKFSLREPKYSHAGIVSVENNNIYVYHCIGGEDNPQSELRKDPLESFCSPELAHAFGIYRLPIDDAAAQKLVLRADSLFRKKIMFDEDFDLSTDHKMYCTEFVYKSIKSLVTEKIALSSSEVSGKKYIACDNLFLIPQTKLIYQTNY